MKTSNLSTKLKEAVLGIPDDPQVWAQLETGEIATWLIEIETGAGGSFWTAVKIFTDSAAAARGPDCAPIIEPFDVLGLPLAKARMSAEDAVRIAGLTGVARVEWSGAQCWIPEQNQRDSSG